MKHSLISVFAIFYLITFTSEAIASCEKRIKWSCGVTYHHNTKSQGESVQNDYSFCSSSLTGFHGYEAVYYYQPSSVHDIFFEFYDSEKKGLDYFIIRNFCETGDDGMCLMTKIRSGSDPQYYSYTLKDADPKYIYYVIIDSKNQGTEGDYQFKATCVEKGNKEYLCDNYMNAHCGTKYSGHTNDGFSNYHDYSCFHNNATGFNAKEVVYKFTNRPNTTHDITLDFYDRDDIGQDLFVIENCGENNYKCYAYIERSSSDPQQFQWIIKNCNPNKDYYLIIDAKNATGRYEFTAFCYKQDYFCENFEDLKCGFEKSGHTQDGFSNYNDYSCFKSHLTGFHAKERIYKLTDYPSSNYDLEITFEDLDDRGLDLFLVENCGENDYQCYAYYERNSSNPKKEVFTWYNLDYRKEYYIIIDAKSVSGRYKIYANCKVKGYLCDQYEDIDCNKKKYGHTKNGHSNYDDYSCFDSHLTGYYSKELVYKIKNRPNYEHDLYIDFEDIFRKGLDIYVVENCGSTNYRCYAYKERSSSDPRKDNLIVYNTDPNKDYYIIIDAKNVTSDYYLTVRCEDRTQCYDACFDYVRNSDGSYNFYFPNQNKTGYDYYSWYFEKEGSGQSDSKSGGNLFGYNFKYGSGVYKVAIYDSSNDPICYYYIDYDDCSDNYPMARPFEYREYDCSGNTCKYDLDASGSMGSGLYYHWYFTYDDYLLNKHYTSMDPEMTVDVEYSENLVGICLVITNPCGMSSYCIQGDCVEGYPEYNISQTSDTDIAVDFDSWSVSCNNEGRKVYIDWGNGKSDDYNYSSNLRPTYSYDQPGNYLVCVRYYYECSGTSYDRGCTICVCKTVSLGCQEDIRDPDCAYLFYEQGAYEDGQWRYFLSHDGGPDGYDFYAYQYMGGSSQEVETSQDGEIYLEPGYEYEICALYKNSQGCYYYCCQTIEVFYPSAINFHLPSEACGGTGSIVSIPVSVAGFSEVTGFQFKISVNDANVAAIQSEISDLNQELDLAPGDVIVSTSQNLINVAWTSSQANEAKSLPDGAVLFVFQVMFTGQSGQSTSMEFEDALAFNNLTNQQIDISFDNGNLCIENSYSIQGSLFTDDGAPIANAMVILEGLKSEVQQTDENGSYEFTGLIRGDYQVTPTKEQDFHAGVNVIDLAMIKGYNRSVEGDVIFSPHQLIAANSRKVLDGGLLTVADETAINRMVSFDIDEFEDYSDAWLFIPASFEFMDASKANLETTPSSISFEDLQEPKSDQDFIGVKIGDINGSVASAAPRSASAVGISFSDVQGEVGDTILVDLMGTAFQNIQNIQFTAFWDSTVLAYQGWQSGLEDFGLEESNFSERFINEGKLTFAFSNAPGSISFEDTTIFSLRFVVIGGDNETSLIDLIDDPVEILITDDQLEAQDVTVRSGTVSVGMVTAAEEFDQNSFIQSNRPNPFSDYTIIPFSLTNRTEITINVFNNIGRRIMHHKANYTAGDHFFRIDQNHLGEPGIYYYQVITDRLQTSKSMIMMR